jgi:hypothetical protein
MMRLRHDALAGIWPRASAILGRHALEAALDKVWRDVAPGLEDASRRAQLLCLPEFVHTDLANRARYAWYGLSAACHYHAYELPPTASELEGWFADVDALIDGTGTDGAGDRDAQRGDRRPVG